MLGDALEDQGKKTEAILELKVQKIYKNCEIVIDQITGFKKKSSSEAEEKYIQNWQ